MYAHNLYLCIRFEKDNKKSQSQKVEAETLKLLTGISQKVKSCINNRINYGNRFCNRIYALLGCCINDMRNRFIVAQQPVRAKR